MGEVMATKQVRADELEVGMVDDSDGSTIETVSDPFYGGVLVKYDNRVFPSLHDADQPVKIRVPEPTLEDALACMDEYEGWLVDRDFSSSARKLRELRAKYGVERRKS
jgi:hypothetical protein